MRRDVLVLCALAATSAACRRRPRRAPPPAVVAPASEAVLAADAGVVEAEPDELLPGRATAFGLTLPAVASARFEGDETRMYHVSAQMPRVLRYLEQRLEFNAADIQPLGAMIRGARLREGNATSVLDIGIRDEGDRTLVTVWNRTPVAVTRTRTGEESLRAAGYDPQTRRLDPLYNR